MKKILALTTVAIMGAVMVAGCLNQEAEEEQLTFITPDTYPIETDVTLRYWMELSPHVSASNTSFNTTEIAAYLEEATGIKVKFEHPVAGQADAAFNILQSSNDMPDIMERDWTDMPGGPERLIREGVLTDLTPYIENVSPNLKGLLSENPDWAIQIMTDKGKYFEYPFIRPDEKLATFMTYIIRKDLLDKAGLAVPETLDEWEKALYVFKDMGIESPLSLRLSLSQFTRFSPFTGVFGIGSTFYQVGGTVKYGPYEPEFADYIKLLRKWYDDGILDKEFADEDSKRRAAMVTNGKNGAIDATIGGEFGNYLSAILPDSGIEYVATKIPVRKAGDTPMFAQKDWPVRDCAGISGASKNKELAARFLDFGYSEQGHMLYNFGKEGVSYEMKDGIPTYTGAVIDPEQNGDLSVAQGMAKYIRACYNGPFEQDVNYITQYYQRDEQKQAMELWDSETLDYILPTSLNIEEAAQERYTDIMTPINTYLEDTLAKLVSGKLDIDYLDTYYTELKRLGIEEAIAIKQTAYNNYLKRARFVKYE